MLVDAVVYPVGKLYKKVRFDYPNFGSPKFRRLDIGLGRESSRTIEVAVWGLGVLGFVVI